MLPVMIPQRQFQHLQRAASWQFGKCKVRSSFGIAAQLGSLANFRYSLRQSAERKGSLSLRRQPSARQEIG